MGGIDNRTLNPYVNSIIVPLAILAHAKIVLATYTPSVLTITEKVIIATLLKMCYVQCFINIANFFNVH